MSAIRAYYKRGRHPTAARSEFISSGDGNLQQKISKSLRCAVGRIEKIIFPDHTEPHNEQTLTENSPREQFLARFNPSFACENCKDTLRLRCVVNNTGEHTQVRCACVAARTKNLSLRIGQLCLRRAEDSQVSENGFENLLRTLRGQFSFQEPIDIEILSPSALGGIDVLILCTTNGPALTKAELVALKDWVRSGGALIVSGFSQFSVHGHYARDTVGWLGIEPDQNSTCSPKMTHTIVQPSNHELLPEPSARRLGVQAHAMLTTSKAPFGEVTEFQNVGETVAKVHDLAKDLGAIDLVDFRNSKISPSLTRQHFFAAANQWAGLDGNSRPLSPIFYPPGTEITGVKGRVLVCSNLHWLCDETYWAGGTFTEGSQSCRLLLNFVAGAIASRVPIDL